MRQPLSIEDTLRDLIIERGKGWLDHAIGEPRKWDQVSNPQQGAVLKAWEMQVIDDAHLRQFGTEPFREVQLAKREASQGPCINKANTEFTGAALAMHQAITEAQTSDSDGGAKITFAERVNILKHAKRAFMALVKVFAFCGMRKPPVLQLDMFRGK
ncbi:MAG: hypothetical protein AAF141_05640 [Pseudomonadota bacterium]